MAPHRLFLWLRLASAAALALRGSWKAPTLARVPAIYTADDARPIVLFDGECNLCNAGVNLLLDRDRCGDPRGDLRCAALQSAVGRLLLARLPAAARARAVDAASGEYASIVVAGERRAWVGSAAVLKIGRSLRGPLRALALLGSCVPAPLRDPVYGFVSKRRKRWFGAADSCRLWDDNWETRFVSDDRLGLAAPTDAPDARDDPTPSFATGDAVVVASTQPVPLDGGALLANGLRGVVGDVAGATATVVLDVDGAEVTADVAAAALRAA